MDFTMELLNTNDAGSVLAGLQCFLAICRAFRYKAVESADRQNFERIVEGAYPRLLAITNELINQESDEAGEMLHLSLKAYKHTTWVSIPLFRTWGPGQISNRTTSWSSPRTCNSETPTSLGSQSFSRLWQKQYLPTLCRATRPSARSTIGGRPRNGPTSTSTAFTFGKSFFSILGQQLVLLTHYQARQPVSTGKDRECCTLRQGLPCQYCT